MESKAKILYAEDDKTLAFVTKDNLELAGYEIVHADNGLEAFELFKEQKFDICVLDVMMPILDGFTVAKRIRRMDQDIPIIFLTAKSMEMDKIEGLTLGADDYMVKPFSIEELRLKIEIFLQRATKKPKEEPAHLFEFNELIFDHKNLLIIMGNEEISLTQREADVMRLFCMHKGELVKKKDILLKIWGDDDYFAGRSLDVFISRLRKYIKPCPSLKIDNVHGIGFRLVEQVEAQ